MTKRTVEGIARTEEAAIFIGNFLVRFNTLEFYLDFCISIWLSGSKDYTDINEKYMTAIAPSMSFKRKLSLLKLILESTKNRSTYPTLLDGLQKLNDVRNKLAHGSDLVRESDIDSLKKSEIAIQYRTKGSIGTLFINPDEETHKLMKNLETVMSLRDSILAKMKSE